MSREIQEVAAKNLNCIPVTMKCKGKLARIRGFYKALQGLDRLVRIENFELTNDRDFDGIVTMQTEAVIYYRKDIKQG